MTSNLSQLRRMLGIDMMPSVLREQTASRPEGHGNRAKRRLATLRHTSLVIRARLRGF